MKKLQIFHMMKEFLVSLAEQYVMCTVGFYHSFMYCKYVSVDSNLNYERLFVDTIRYPGVNSLTLYSEIS